MHRSFSGLISRAVIRIVYAFVVLCLFSNTIYVRTASASSENDLTAVTSQSLATLTYSTASFARPQPHLAKQPIQSANLTASTSYPPISCRQNCTQLDEYTVVYSGSGTASGMWNYSPPILYERSVQAMEVYYMIKGLRIVSHNPLDIWVSHTLQVEVAPGWTVFRSPDFYVPPRGYHDFVVPNVNTSFYHDGLNRLSAIQWVIIKDGTYNVLEYSWTADQIVISSKPIDMTLFYDNSVVNQSNCVDGDCQVGSVLANATGAAVDPVNTRTGAFSYANTDLSIPTSAGNLVFERSYSSAAITRPADLLGPGWTHNHAARLIFAGDPGGLDGYVIFRSTAGNDYLFWIEPDGTYTAAPGVMALLTRSSGPPVTYTLKTSTQTTFIFDETGRLLERRDAQGQTIAYQYDTNGRLETVSADGGSHYLTFGYDTQGRIESVADQTGRDVSFNYDEAGDLTGFTDVLDQTWTYQYDSGHNLTKILDPTNQPTVQNEYEGNSVVRQYNGEGELAAEIEYNPDSTTTITDALGNQTTHTYDIRGALAEETNLLSGNVTQARDGNFRPDTITDARNNSTTLEWSDDGANLTYIKDASEHETFISYDSYNNPTSIIDPLTYETHYFYEDSNFPTLPTKVEYPLSYDGGATFISTQHGYYQLNNSEGQPAGKLKFETDALGKQTYYTYTSSGQIETVTTAYGTTSAQTTSYVYDDFGRLVQVTDPAGVITRSEYDAAGRLTKTIQNADPNNPQQNLVSTDGKTIYNVTTRYRYDPRGNAIAVIDTHWGITRTYYDLADRSVAVVQNLVINGNLASSEADVTAAVNTALEDVPDYDSAHPDRNILTRTEYDDTGRVLVTYDPADVKTRTYYDDVNRRQVVIQNWVGSDLYGDISTAPDYDPAFPDQNIWTEYLYDANHNLIATRDTLGKYTRTYYDKLNRPSSVVENWVGEDIYSEFVPARGTDTNIRTDTYYDANGNVIATQDPREVWTRTYYDALNRPVAVVQNLTGKAYTDPALPDPAQGECGTEENLCSFTYYDQAGNVIATVDPRGIVTRTYYDEANRPTDTVQNLVGQDIYIETLPPSGEEDTNVLTHIEYDEFGRRSATTDPLGHVTQYEYNPAGQLLKVTASFLDGQPQNYQDRFNIVTEYTYDALGRQVSQTDTLDRTSLNSYDELGRLKSSIQNYQAGQPQNYEDTAGNRYNLITAYAYDVRGNQIAVTDTTGTVTRTYYDSLARPVTVVRNLVGHDIFYPLPPARSNPPSSENNLHTDTVYLGNGSVDYVVDEMGQTTDYETDGLGRVTATSDSLLNATHYQFDANGNRVSITDAESVTTRYDYDNLNRLTDVTENYRAGVIPDFETNVHTIYTYDAGGNLLSIRDGNSNLEGVSYKTVFTYDGLGRQKTETDPLSHQTASDYDAMGNRVSVDDANGNHIAYQYDELNRLVRIDYPAPEPDVTFEYDAAGRRTSMVDGVGTTSWTPDNLNRPASITDPFDANVSYKYDEAGNVSRITYPDASAVDYGYNGANRLTAVSGGGMGGTVQYEYDAAGHLKTIERPNGVTSAYNYYDNGWLQDITHSSATEALASYQYQYDNVGNRTQASENVLRPSSSLQSAESIASGSQEEVVSTAPAPATTQEEMPSSLTYTSQPDGETGEDTYLLSKPANQNYGEEMELRIGESSDAQDEVSRGLIRFDLSSIPADAVVISAQLSLWPSVDSAENDRTIQVYRLKTAFDEAGATWEEAAPGMPWEAEGASGAEDRENAAIGFAPMLGNEPVGVEKQIALSPSKVQEWIDGTFANHGLLIGVDTELDDRFSYESSDSSADTQRPKLTIQYTVPEGDEPSAPVPPTEISTPPPLSAEDALLEQNDSLAEVDGLSALSGQTLGYTVSLLHMNGEDGSSTFTDEAGKVWTAAGNAQIDTDQSKFGGASGLFDGTGDYLTTPDNDNFYLSNANWTIDFWVRFDLAGGTKNLVSQYQDANNWMNIWLGSDWTRLTFSQVSNGVQITHFYTDWQFSTNTWYHIAIMRNGDTPLIAINGVQQSVTQTTTIAGKSLSNLSGPLTIGAWNASGFLSGRIDEFRFSKGVARWTGNFTPPASEYVFTFLPEAATLVSPSGNTVESTPTYTWNEVPSATWYYLWVDGPSGNLIKNWYTKAQANCNGSTCSVTPAMSLTAGTHTWWVQTWNEEGLGPWSAEMSFSPVPPGKATLVSPNGNIVTTTPTYTWNEVPGATWYYLWVNIPSGPVIQTWYTAQQANCNGATCAVTPTTALSSGTHTWWIQTWSSAGLGPWSDAMTFTPVPPGKATLISPSGSVETTTPTYTWNEVAGATRYDLEVNGPSGNVILQSYTAAQANCNGSTCWVTPSVTLSNEIHTWRVQTSSSLGLGPWSDAMTFTPGQTSVTITYDYDPLYRLTAADYSNNDYYHYAYDAVGNRLTQESMVSGLPSTVSYNYDHANRLETVNGTTYTWDNNGNLLNDGVNTYTYDAANRLSTFANGTDSATYSYNGLGDRLNQTVNGVPTNYTLDLNAGLTQVLDNGTYSYTYGVGRISQQQGTTAEYFLGDALGSVRQLTDQSSAVTLAKSYDPYGNFVNSMGNSSSTFAYTGEQQDISGLMYLRARYYDSINGRFTNRDPSKLEANLYLYAAANPIVLSDPTGLFPIRGPIALAECFDLHSGSHGVYGNENGVVYVSAQEAVDSCKRAYNPDTWSKGDFDLTGDHPTSGHDLFGWFLFKGSGRLLFDAKESLTQEMSKSGLMQHVRFWYYILGDSLTPANTYREYKFNILEQAQCLPDWFNHPGASVPLTCILGSFYYQVKTLDNGEVGFRIDNRTDLESGTHVAGRFPPDYTKSVEGLIDQGIILGSEPLLNVIADPKLQVISILSRSSGPELVQTYVWKEKHDLCQPLVGRLLDPLSIDVWSKFGSDGYEALTVSPY